MDIREIACRAKPSQIRIDAHASYGLTELGKVKTEEDFGALRGPALAVASYLSDYGTSKPRDISRDLEIPEATVREVLKRLVAAGLVRAVVA